MDLSGLQQKLGFQFRNPDLLQLALTHPSVAHEQSSTVQTNQRLEFLGDAVLQLVLTVEVYHRFIKVDEGWLTKARAKLVNQAALADQARRLELGAHLQVSRGEDMHGGRDRPSALADSFEALLGAMYLDAGYEAVREFVLRQFGPSLADLNDAPIIENPKGELQEYLQAASTESPSYQVSSVSGPDHDRQFECTVHHAGRELARGVGKSKKAAESKAALVALARLRSESSTLGPQRTAGPTADDHSTLGEKPEPSGETTPD